MQSFNIEFIPAEAPVTVRVTPILPADQMPDEMAMFEYIAMILRRESIIIAQRLSNRQIPRDQLLSRANGYLQMINVDNNSHAHIADLPLRDLNILSLMELFDRAHSESNPDLTIYTVEWSFWVNPESVSFGGSAGKPLNNTCEIANKNYEFDNIKVGCAAICATIFRIKHEPQFHNLNHNIKRKSAHRKIYDLAMELQNKLGTE